MAELSSMEIGARFSSAALPPAYDAYMVPAVFRPWAGRLCDLAGLQPGEHVLDVATGPGTVARVAAARVGSGGRVTGIDLSAPMLAVARSKPHEPGTAPIEYVECPADRLLVPDAAFGVALCQQGLQFFPDRPTALREIARALRPGGRVALAVWDTPASAGHCFRSIGLALRDLGMMPPQIPLMTAEDLTSLLAGAGFHDVEVEPASLELVVPGGVEAVLKMQEGTPRWPEIESLSPEDYEQFRQRAAAYLEPLLDAKGTVRSPSTTWLARAVK